MGMGLVSRLGNETHPHLNPPLEGEESLLLTPVLKQPRQKAGLFFIPTPTKLFYNL